MPHSPRTAVKLRSKKHPEGSVGRVKHEERFCSFERCWAGKATQLSSLLICHIIAQRWSKEITGRLDFSLSRCFCVEGCLNTAFVCAKLQSGFLWRGKSKSFQILTRCWVYSLHFPVMTVLNTKAGNIFSPPLQRIWSSLIIWHHSGILSVWSHNSETTLPERKIWGGFYSKIQSKLQSLRQQRRVRTTMVTFLMSN